MLQIWYKFPILVLIFVKLVLLRTRCSNVNMHEAFVNVVLKFLSKSAKPCHF